MTMLTILREQIKNPHTAHTTPNPKLTRLGMCLVGVMAEILGHCRPRIPQRESQAAVEVVIGCYAMGDRLGFRQQDIAGNFMNHESVSQ